MIINAKILLEPHNRRGRLIRCGRQTTSASVPPVIGGEMIPSETTVRQERRESERRHEDGDRAEPLNQ